MVMFNRMEKSEVASNNLLVERAGGGGCLHSSGSKEWVDALRQRTNINAKLLGLVFINDVLKIVVICWHRRMIRGAFAHPQNRETLFFGQISCKKVKSSIGISG